MTLVAPAKHESLESSFPHGSSGNPATFKSWTPAGSMRGCQVGGFDTRSRRLGNSPARVPPKSENGPPKEPSGGCLLADYFSFFSSFSSARTTFFPHRSHFPSAVIQGCLGASPPQIPHLVIVVHLLSIALLRLPGPFLTATRNGFCSRRYIGANFEL